MKLPVVAIIGQTNAGKSSLFNRLVRKAQAIVAREEGTTRDNVVGKVEDQYLLIDTAGLKDPNDEFSKPRRYSYRAQSSQERQANHAST